MFKPISSKANFPEIESNVLELWEKNNIFEKSLENRKNCEEFVFYDGPPFATGLPHYGHLLACTIKDVVPRYQTMKGKYVERVFGWDCHGLPIEYEMEKKLNLSGKKEIEEYGIDKFNEACRGIVLRYTKEWETIVKRLGRWVDFENGYKTMDKDYMESIWWVFKKLWDKGLIYEGYKILPYCPRCSTPISNFEANQGYAEIQDPSITVRFQSKEDKNAYFLSWTTTPWTMPSNMALAVGPEIDYVKIKDGEEFYILAEAKLGDYYKNEDMYTIVDRFKGESLLDKKYLPLFPYFKHLEEEGAFRIVTADYVTTEEGTGIVHTAPGFGEDDANTGKTHGIPEVCPLDEECRFTSTVEDFAGQYVKSADKEIIKKLKQEKKLVYRGTVTHNYPHCWRDDSPLIYRAVSTWFVRVEQLKEKMLEANEQIRWVPDHIKHGRFGKWLENAKDWAISRNRYWGCPLPIWYNAENNKYLCVGSVEELENLTGEKIEDIHKHYVDNIEIPGESNEGSYKRVSEVLDCWFESGSMPYAQKHYPFENKEWFEKNYPADFIAEGLDQTRGWFYTLIVLGAALFDKPAFKNVVVNGLVLGEDGQKMSKRKNNYPDPVYIINNYGADALRLVMLGSPVVRGDDLKFSEQGVKDILRNILLPLWNSFSFFTTYANVDNWTPPKGNAAPPENLSNPLDKWILSSLCSMVDEIETHMDNYRLQKAANRFESFVEDLTNWYIRRSRRRFWKSQNDSDKDEAYSTLYYVLVTFTKTACPFIPFITEEIYRHLKTDEMPESVHLCDYPVLNNRFRNTELESQMRYTISAVTLGRYLRTKREIKIRQPLNKVMIITPYDKVKEQLSETVDIIKEELNVKKIEFKQNEEELVDRYAKANFKVLGPKLGKDMKEVANSIADFNEEQVASLLEGGTETLVLNSGKKVEITQDEIQIIRCEKKGLTAATEGDITVALDTNLDKTLLEEGFAREFVSKVQNIRKDINLNVTDRINIKYYVPENCHSSVENFSEHIKSETLGDSLIYTPQNEFNKETEYYNINGKNCYIKVHRT